MTPHPLPAAAIADALVRLRQEARLAPPAIRRVIGAGPIAGPALTCRHFGSVDVFLELFEGATPGSVLVIDNEGRDDEGCIGDLTVAEAKLAGIAGIVLWGYHRDAAALSEIALPLWSLGSVPAGPRGVRPPSGAVGREVKVGSIDVSDGDMVVADDDGVVFVSWADWPEVERIAREIVEVESRQAALIAGGTSLRSQLRFSEYLAKKAADPTYTLRRHLAETGGAIET